MSFRNFLFIPALLCATAAFGQGAPKSAHADIVNAQGQKIGTAKIVAEKKGVKIEVKVAQLPAGTHGIHIHAVGKCEGPDFKTAGGHLNPDTKKHGKDNPEGPHVGDLLNIEVKADGTGKATLLNTMVTLGRRPELAISRRRHRTRDPRKSGRLQNGSGGELGRADCVRSDREIIGVIQA